MRNGKTSKLVTYIVTFVNPEGATIRNEVWLPKMSKKHLMDVITYNAPEGFTYHSHKEV